jgi:phosphodiesterase/alkaline phosphatase D-like protein
LYERGNGLNPETHFREKEMKMLFWLATFCMHLAILSSGSVHGQSAATLSRLPILGLQEGNQISIQVRGNTTGNISVAHHEVNDSQDTFSDWTRLSFANDLSANLVLQGVIFNRSYEYRVEFDNGSATQWFSFTTFPEQSNPGEFNFVFSACVRDRYAPHPVFHSIDDLAPTFVALLGDQMYADSDRDINTGPEGSVLPALRAKYARNFDEHFQTMSSQTALVAVWDDHDYGQDNSDNTYQFKDKTKQVFKETFPAYPSQVDDGGLYFQYTVADVDFFVLDTRWYRSPMQEPDIQRKTMLGPEQLSWLLNGSKQSTAPFKMIFSSVSFNDYGGDKSSGRTGFDSWMGYKTERAELISFIKTNGIEGVLVFSGDQHYPSTHILNWQTPLNAISETASSIDYSVNDLGTAVFDFSASPLHNTSASGFTLIPANQEDPSFSHEVFRGRWNDRTDGGSLVGSGIYFYRIIAVSNRLTSNSLSVTNPMIFLK